ncbi:MAG: NADH-quinone oxidoreductase subunit NuoE [Candidatus Aminicenantales bacterium]|jgi:NADH-quinone oxidoreductase E subunit
MKFSLSAESARRVDELVRRYPKKAAALLPVLHIVQREKGFVSPEAEEWVAATLGVPPIQVREVLSFYTLLRRQPAGKYVIQVCRNISCFLAGSEDIVNYLETKLAVQAGETTADGKFTLVTVECLGNCDHAPCLMVNDDDYGPVSRSAIDGILKGLI